MNDKRETIVELSKNALVILEEAYESTITEGIPKEKALNDALNVLEKMRHGENNNNYYWIIDTTPIMIMHPFRKDLIGQDLTNFHDSTGNNLFTEAVDVVLNNKSGYVNYIWEQIEDSSQIVPKESYVILFEPWGLIIGLALYMDDVNADINKITSKVMVSSVIIMIFIAILLLLSVRSYFMLSREKESTKSAWEVSEEKFRNIFENSNDAILLFKEQKLIECNKRAFEMFNIPGYDISLFTYEEFFLEHTNKEKSIFSLLEKMIQSNVSLFEWKFKKYSGEGFIAEISPMYIKIKGISHTLCIIKDITQQKISESRIEYSENKFQTIFNSVTDGIVIFSETGKMLEINDIAAKRTGFPRKEVMKLNANVFFQNNPNITIPFVLEELIKKDFVYFDIEYDRVDGSRLPIEVYAKKINYEGHKAVIAVTRDITERVMMEKRIFNAEMTAQENERQRVARELHDGVSPILSTIKLYAQSLNNYKDESMVNNVLDKMTKSINETIQTISEISNNLSPHILQNFGFKSALRSFIEKVTETNTIKITHESNYIERIDNNIETSLYRIATELINNTLKHARAKNIHIVCNFMKTEVNMNYRDDGIGFNLDNLIDNKKGMGLFNMQNRINSLNGSLTFNKLKKGIEFDINVPIDH